MTENNLNFTGDDELDQYDRELAQKKNLAEDHQKVINEIVAELNQALGDNLPFGQHKPGVVQLDQLAELLLTDQKQNGFTNKQPYLVKLSQATDSEKKRAIIILGKKGMIDSSRLTSRAINCCVRLQQKDENSPEIETLVKLLQLTDAGKKTIKQTMNNALLEITKPISLRRLVKTFQRIASPEVRENAMRIYAKISDPAQKNRWIKRFNKSISLDENSGNRNQQQVWIKFFAGENPNRVAEFFGRSPKPIKILRALIAANSNVLSHLIDINHDRRILDEDIAKLSKIYHKDNYQALAALYLQSSRDDFYQALITAQAKGMKSKAITADYIAAAINNFSHNKIAQILNQESEKSLHTTAMIDLFAMHDIKTREEYERLKNQLTGIITFVPRHVNGSHVDRSTIGLEMREAFRLANKGQEAVLALAAGNFHSSQFTIAQIVTLAQTVAKVYAEHEGKLSDNSKNTALHHYANAAIRLLNSGVLIADISVERLKNEADSLAHHLLDLHPKAETHTYAQMQKAIKKGEEDEDDVGRESPRVGG